MLICILYHKSIVRHLGLSEIQAEFTNLHILPNFVKIKNHLKVLKFQISNFSKIGKIRLFRLEIWKNLE